VTMAVIRPRAQRLSVVGPAMLAACALLAAACSGGSGGSSSSATAPPATTASSTAPSPSYPYVVPDPLPDPRADLDEAELGGIRFTDVTTDAGLERDHSNRDQIGEDGMTAAVSVVDIDSDGWPDLFVSRVGDASSLYRNQRDGTFVDIAADAGLEGPNPAFGTGPAHFFDADGDGDLDVYVAVVGAESDRLYLNDGSGRFEDRTVEAGVFQPPPSRLRNGDHVHGLATADIDLDGDLDLVVVQWDTAVPESAAAVGVHRESSSGEKGLDRFGDVCAGTKRLQQKGFSRVPNSSPNRSRLWINNGDGTFRDGTQDWGLGLDEVLAFTPVFGDLDGDRLPDLTVTGDSCTSRLYRNVDGRGFEDVTEAAGVGTDENGMGSVLRDLDGDGHLDWFITGISFPNADESCPILAISGCTGNRLYRNRGDGTFEDRTDEFGLRHGWWGWGAAIEDFGNDGRLQVVMTNGFSEDATRRAEDGDWSYHFFKWFIRDPMRFWVPTADGYLEAADEVGLTDTAVGLGLVPIDYDLDGDLDLFVANSEVSPRLYRNDTPNRRWLRIRLDDPATPGNRAGIGARVEVTLRKGADPVVHEVQTGGSYESQKLPEFHLGLGRRRTVELVEVYWPGSDRPQRLEGVNGDQILTIVRAGDG
jgi:enediyne biosynthesis protein E4